VPETTLSFCTNILEPVLFLINVQSMRTSFRMPRALLKRLKRVALDNDMSLAALALEAFEDVIKKYEK
jgi:predicted DNA-binding protein